MIIDFTEMPKANEGGGKQDTFELFSRDLLQILGYEIIGEPVRGADGGIDIKVKEVRKGIGGHTDVFWLVSCKHYAHSKKAISPDIEFNIGDRVSSNGCTGFIGMYSYIATNGLKTILEGNSSKIEYQLFDQEKIESRIVGTNNLEHLFLRYFPNSYKRWKELYYYIEPVKLFESHLEQNYKEDNAISLFQWVFRSTGNFIKSVRNFPNYADAFISNDYKVKIDNDFNAFNYRRSLDFWIEEKPWSLTKEKTDVDFLLIKKYHPYTDFLEGIVRPISGSGLIRYVNNDGKNAQYKYGLNNAPRLWQYILDYKRNGFMYNFQNLVIVDENYNEYLTQIFKDLKEVLT